MEGISPFLPRFCLKSLLCHQPKAMTDSDPLHLLLEGWVLLLHQHGQREAKSKKCFPAHFPRESSFLLDFILSFIFDLLWLLLLSFCF